MTNASSLAFPGSRTLATWWRQLAPFEPQCLSVGYLFLHRVEACAIWLQQEPLDPFLLFVLEALEREEKSFAPIFGRLCHRLNLDGVTLRPIVQSLVKLELVVAREAFWQVTDQGRDVLRTRNLPKRVRKRGLFSFVERLSPTGTRRAQPHYLNVADAAASAWHFDAALGFDLGWLQDCLDQPTAWRDTFGFPADLTAFTEPDRTSTNWDQVIVDHPERLLIAFFEGPEPAAEQLGYGVRLEGWALNTASPIVRLPGAARFLIAELGPPDTADLWHQAWQAWCQARTVPLADARACSLSLERECLRIAAPERLIQYLQAGKSDVFKGETWILAGDGYIRRAARLEINIEKGR